MALLRDVARWAETYWGRLAEGLRSPAVEPLGPAVARARPRLSKSRYVAGLQCPKMLWWTVHEPDAPELAPSEGLQAVFDRGSRVGQLAREHVPGGVLVDLPHHRLEARVEATAEALASGARTVYEASFFADGIFVAVDILERQRDGFALVEVKSTLDVKDAHLPDVGVQVYVARRAGIDVRRAEVMHLNRECRHPDLSNLFVREDVTALVRPYTRAVPKRARELREALAGELPEVAVGPHCTEPYECAFMDRCWPKQPAHHVSTLYQIRKKRVDDLVAQGIETVRDVPRDLELPPTARRQVRSVKSGKLVVERGLRRALEALEGPIAFLDFETVHPAIPGWPGCRPYEQVAVQMSCHVADGGDVTHHAWLAERGVDPRPGLARAVVDACAGARTILAYNAPFERRCIAGMMDAAPELFEELNAVSGRLRDLLPLVRDHVYHPGFGGSFSLKKVLPALVPGCGYEDLGIQDGDTASRELERLLLGDAPGSAAARRRLRGELLQYCERDTLAMVRLFERLCELGGAR